MSLSFPDRAVIRLPVVMMNGRGEFISGEARSNNPRPKGRGYLRAPPQTPHRHGGDSGRLPRGQQGHSQPAGLTNSTPSTAKPWPPPSPPRSHQPFQQRGPPGRPAGRSCGARDKARSHGLR